MCAITITPLYVVYHSTLVTGKKHDFPPDQLENIKARIRGD